MAPWGPCPDGRDRRRGHAPGGTAGAGDEAIGAHRGDRLRAQRPPCVPDRWRPTARHRRPCGCIPEPGARRRPAGPRLDATPPTGPPGRRSKQGLAIGAAAVIACAAAAQRRPLPADRSATACRPSDGGRMIAGPGTGPSAAFGTGPRRRGPGRHAGADGARRVVSDAHACPKAAIARIFDGAAPVPARGDRPRPNARMSLPARQRVTPHSSDPPGRLDERVWRLAGVSGLRATARAPRSGPDHPPGRRRAPRPARHVAGPEAAP